MNVRRFVAAGAVAGMAMFGAVVPSAHAFDGGASIESNAIGVVQQNQTFRIRKVTKALKDRPTLIIHSVNPVTQAVTQFASTTITENGVEFYAWTESQTEQMQIGAALVTDATTPPTSFGAVLVVPSLA
jgi:hypothetical protein